MNHRSKPETPFPLRMSHDLKARLQVRARANKRSLNSELLVTIDEGLRVTEQQKRGEVQHG